MREHEYQCVYKNDPIAIAMASQMHQISQAKATVTSEVPKKTQASAQPLTPTRNPAVLSSTQANLSQVQNGLPPNLNPATLLQNSIQGSLQSTIGALSSGNTASNMQIYQNQLQLAAMAQHQQQTKMMHLQQQAQLTKSL